MNYATVYRTKPDCLADLFRNLLLMDAEGNLIEQRPQAILSSLVHGPAKSARYMAIRGSSTLLQHIYKGYYFTGDGARRDEDGYYWITGRTDDRRMYQGIVSALLK